MKTGFWSWKYSALKVHTALYQQIKLSTCVTTAIASTEKNISVDTKIKQFVGLNQDLVQWSIDISAIKGSTLHGIWFEQYRKQLKYKKPNYAKRLRGDYIEKGLILLNAVSSAATHEARRLFESFDNSDNSGDGSSSEPPGSTSLLFLNKITSMIKTERLLITMRIIDDGDGEQKECVQCVFRNISYEKVEEETIKLLLSSAINLLDDPVVACMVNVSLPGQLKYKWSVKSNFDWNCYRFSNRQSSVKANSALLGFIEYMDINIKDVALETTYYRRFAILLDFVFEGLKIELKDGEAVSEATQIAMEQNDYDELDVLINIQDSTISLDSNEWKSKKTQNIKIKHQSKNRRSNCEILNSLYIISNGLTYSILAMDGIGMVSYLHLQKLKEDTYVTTLMGSVLLPSTYFASTAFKLHSDKDGHHTTTLPTIFFTPNLETVIEYMNHHFPLLLFLGSQASIFQNIPSKNMRETTNGKKGS
ncbi:hypothetical protein BDC45DRAFT_536172 [Circinella umbellata]|nr:hypothetical protein BDC45DRAFT_536172 [Circinella umbellata]